MKKMESLYKKRLPSQVLNSTQGGGFWSSFIGSVGIEVLTGFQDEIVNGIQNFTKNFDKFIDDYAAAVYKFDKEVAGGIGGKIADKIL